MAHSRMNCAAILAAIMMLLVAACGQPLQPLATVTANSPALVNTNASATIDPATQTPEPTVTTTPTPGPSPTPNMQSTSSSVIGTITALAATPTYPPTSTPRPQRTPIGAGPRGREIPATATALFVSGNIAVLTMPQQVFRGGPAALTVKTKPGAICILQVDRSSNRDTRLEPISGIATRSAGRDGVIAWIWTISAEETTGIMHLVIDCGDAGQANLQLKVAE